MTRRPTFLFLAVLSLVRTLAAGPSTNPDAHAGFDGIWNSATATPLERPLQLDGRPHLPPAVR